MRPHFNIYPNHPFVVSNQLPQGFQGLQLQGGEVTTAVHAGTGSIVQQELRGRHFRMVFSIFHFLQPFSLVGLQPSSFISSFLAIKNAIRYSCREMSPAALSQGQFVLLHGNIQEARLDFDKPGVYHLLEVNWWEGIAGAFIPSFDLLRPLSEPKNLRRSFYLTPNSKNAGFSALGMAHALLRFPHKEAGAAVLFEHKIKEYLLSLLMAAAKNPVAVKHINPGDLTTIHSLYERLRDHAEKRYPANELAREANMSEKKLKKLFEQVFGISIFEFHLEARMNESHRLLEEGHLNTKEIASRVGYQLTTSFITKFREFFGYPPSAVKRNN